MLEILAITTPVYLIMALGYAVTRGGLFERTEMRVLGKFVLNIALPGLLFLSLSQRQVAEVLNPIYLLAYTAASLLVMGAGLLYARRTGHRLSAAAIIALGMTCSNSGFIGFPLAVQVVGPQAAVALALCMIVENVVIIPLALALADADNDGQAAGGWRVTAAQSLRGLLRNPMILGIALGIVFSLLQWHLPAPVERAVSILSASSAALGLFVIGSSLVGQRGQSAPLDMAVVAVGKLVALPLAGLGCLWLLPPIAHDLRVAAVVFAAVPMLGVYPVLAQKHGHDGLAAAAQLVTTLVGFVTLTALLWVLRH